MFKLIKPKLQTPKDLIKRDQIKDIKLKMLLLFIIPKLMRILTLKL